MKVKFILTIFERFFAYFVSRFSFIYHSLLGEYICNAALGLDLRGKQQVYFFLARVIIVSVEFDMSGLFGQIAQLLAWILLTYDRLLSQSDHLMLQSTTLPLVFILYFYKVSVIMFSSPEPLGS